MTKSENKTGWTSRSIGSRLQHHFFYLLIKIGGRHLSYFIMYFVVAWYVLLIPSIRKKNRSILKQTI